MFAQTSIWRVAKWATNSLSVGLATLWLLTVPVLPKRTLAITLRSQSTCLNVTLGQILCTFNPHPPPHWGAARPKLYLERWDLQSPRPLGWNDFGFRLPDARSGSGWTFVGIPLWLPTLAFAAQTALRWYAGLCANAERRSSMSRVRKSFKGS